MSDDLGNPISPLKSALESILFVADQPLSVSKLAEAVEATEAEITKTLNEIADEYYVQDRGIQLREVAGGYRMFTHPANVPYIERLFKISEARRLSQAALETLSIIAYKQPVTRLDINAIRGVNSDGALSTLIARGLVKDLGRQAAPGNPILFGTTKRFLEVFGLRVLSDLPPIKDFEPDAEAREQIERNLRTEPMGGPTEPEEDGLQASVDPEHDLDSTGDSSSVPILDPTLDPAEPLEELLAEGWLNNK